ncbi:hypothetical protein BDV10DRAFT_162422 [Aspergillus recurvatus]
MTFNIVIGPSSDYSDESSDASGVNAYPRSDDDIYPDSSEVTHRKGVRNDTTHASWPEPEHPYPAGIHRVAGTGPRREYTIEISDSESGVEHNAASTSPPNGSYYIGDKHRFPTWSSLRASPPIPTRQHMDRSSSFENEYTPAEYVVNQPITSTSDAAPSLAAQERTQYTDHGRRYDFGARNESRGYSGRTDDVEQNVSAPKSDSWNVQETPWFPREIEYGRSTRAGPDDRRAFHTAPQDPSQYGPIKPAPRPRRNRTSAQVEDRDSSVRTSSFFTRNRGVMVMNDSRRGGEHAGATQGERPDIQEPRQSAWVAAGLNLWTFLETKTEPYRTKRDYTRHRAVSPSTRSTTSSIAVKSTISEDLSRQDKDQGAKLRYLSQKLERPGLELRNMALR